MTTCPDCNGTGERDSGGTHPWGEPVYLPCDCKDAEIGRQWREDSSLATWFPLAAERLAGLEAENTALKREAHTWSKAAQTYAAELERHKPLLRQTLEELALVRAAMGVAYGYLWLVNNEPGTPHRYPPEKAAYQARKALRDKLTQAERGHFINAAVAAVRPLTDHDRALTGAKLTDTSGTDC